jgi:hypothetical protein
MKCSQAVGEASKTNESLEQSNMCALEVLGSDAFDDRYTHTHTHTHTRTETHIDTSEGAENDDDEQPSK